MPAIEASSRCYRHLKRNMASFSCMSADQLRTCLELSVADENVHVGNPCNPVVLDCRSFVSYNSGHILDAINVHCPAILRRRSRGCLPLRTVVPNASVCQLLNNSVNHPVILYDDVGTIPKKHSGGVPNEQLSTVEFVAKCLHNEAGLKSVFFLEGGYTNFLVSYPHLCTPAPAAIASVSLCSPSVLSCPVLGRSPGRGSGLPLSSKTFREQQCKNIFDVGPVEILPHLYLGSAGDASRPQLLKELGITSLLNVSRSVACPNLLTLLKGLKYKSIPLRDTSCQVIDCFFQEAFDFIAEAEHTGGKILVHCRAGISRSATICIAYLMWRKRLRMDEAYEHVKSKRRIVSPNFNFMGQLLAFERRLFDTATTTRCNNPDLVSLASPRPSLTASATMDDPVFDFSDIAPCNSDDQLVPQSAEAPL